MFCEKCGATLADNALICEKCGQTVNSAKEPSKKSFCSKIKSWHVFILISIMFIIVSVVKFVQQYRIDTTAYQILKEELGSKYFEQFISETELKTPLLNALTTIIKSPLPYLAGISLAIGLILRVKSNKTYGKTNLTKSYIKGEKKFCSHCGITILSSLKTKVIALTVIIIIVIGVGLIVIKNNVLFGEDKAAYDLIADYAYNFKDPSSVYLVSGSIRTTHWDIKSNREKEAAFEPENFCFYCGLSATNGFGGRSVSYYFFRQYPSGDLEIVEMPNGSDYDCYIIKDELNMDLINKKLQKKFGL